MRSALICWWIVTWKSWSRAIRRAKAKGLDVTCDTAPHYFALNETSIGDYRTFAKVSPPLRSEADRKAIVAGLVDGTIDAVASDHTPSDQDSKRLPFAQAEYGIVGLETLLTLTLEPFHNGEIGLLESLAKITSNPARMLGLKSGRLQRGAAADLELLRRSINDEGDEEDDDAGGTTGAKSNFSGPKRRGCRAGRKHQKKSKTQGLDWEDWEDREHMPGASSSSAVPRPA